MNINNTVNAKAVSGTWPEETAAAGKKVNTGVKEQEKTQAVSYEGAQKTVKDKVQNGLGTGVYTASGSDAEKDKAVLEETFDKNEDANEALNKTADTMNEEDCKALEEEGMTLESYEAERLQRAVARMKENREFEQENLESRIESQEEYNEEIEKIALKNKIPDERARKLGQKLLEAGLPLTEANLMAMVQALDMGSSVATLSDNGMAHMIENHQEATIENIHKASYAGGASVPAGEEAWEAVKSQVEAVIENSGRPVNEETLKDGKWLLDHELPVTEENLEELFNLKGIRTEADEDYLTERMTEAVRQGKLPKEANLDLETVRVRRKLEEIRLTMSAEASHTLEEKGIIVDTEHMKEVIKELRQIEKEYYKALLSEAGEEPTIERTDLLKETLEKAEAVGKGPAYVLGKTLETRHKETLNTLYQETEAMRQDERLNKAYEPLWTAPRKDMGDSIQKAFQNVDALLSELQLEPTEDNQRAVRILGYNRMEITGENINRVKAYDARVNEVLTGLKPAVTVELIRRGENPLDMTFDDLQQSVNAIKDTIGAGTEEKYSTYLWKLEKQGGQITEDERKSYIGIYRLLNNIEKTDGAAIGAVLNTDRELTLSNLLTAVRTLKNKGVNQKVDDDFGGLTEIKFSSESISEQINTAFRKSDRTEYLQSLVTRTLDEMSPEQVMAAMEASDGNPMEQSLESFCESIMAQEKDTRLEKDHQKEQMKMVQELSKASGDAVAFLEAYGVGTTLKNIQAAGEWFTGNKNLFKEIAGKADNLSEEKNTALKEAAKGFLESMEDTDSRKESLRTVTDTLQGIVAESFSDPEITSDGAETLRLMQKGIALASRLSRQEHYEMPVVIGEEVSSLSLTILKGTKESGKAEIRIDFPEQGTVEAELTIRNDEIKGFILCETTEGQQLIEGCLKEIKTGFESLGLTVKQLNASTDSTAAKRSVKGGNKEGRPAETRMLYQAAKVLVKQTIERTQVIKNEN